MHIVGIAWIFVVVLMALAEGTSPQGSWLGAFFTLLFYGLLPLALVLYLLGTPMRRRARRHAESGALEFDPAGSGDPQQPSAGHDPDSGGVAPGDTVSPVRKEP
jgi:hypothetical protein